MCDSSAERRPQRADQSTIDETNQPTNSSHCNLRPGHHAGGAPAFAPAGVCPDQPREDMDTQSTINPLASSDVGRTAGHDAAASVRARGECDGERVCYARDANCVLSSTTLSPRARQVVVPHADGGVTRGGTEGAVESLSLLLGTSAIIYRSRRRHSLRRCEL